MSVVLALVGESWFVHATGVLQAKLPPRAPAAALAAVETQHHDIVVLAMLLGSVIAVLSGILANGPTARGQFLTVGNIAVTSATFATIGLALGVYRVLALVLMVIIAAVGAYGRRYGQYAAVAGTVALVGYLYGYFVSRPLGVGAAGWTAVMVAIGAAASVVIRALFFRPSTRRELVLSARTYGARVHRVFELAMTARRVPPRWRRIGLEQRLAGVDEAALALEAQLRRFARSSPVRGTEVDRLVEALVEALFDEETAVTEVVRNVRLVPAAAPDPLRQLLRCLVRALAATNPDDAQDAIHALRAELGDNVRKDNARKTADGTAQISRVVAHRVVDAADALVQAGPSVVSRVVELAAKTGRTDTPAPPALAPVVARPPSSTAVGGRAALVSVRPSVPPYLRATVQMTVAVSIAIVAGYALAGQRFYWAVISVLVVLLGTNTLAEQLRKAGERVVGVLVGVGVGTGLVDLVGHNSVWSAVIVVLAVWLGVYFIRGYHWGTMALAVTVSLSQAYLSLGEFSNGLLWERLAEVALGAAAAMVTVAVVLPVRTRRVVDQALAKTVESLSDLTDAAAAPPPASRSEATYGSWVVGWTATSKP
ncbi:MAG: FUSC family protein [Acidimicrobiales bacterium]